MDNTLQELYQQYVGVAPTRVSRLAGAGSARHYYRLSSPGTSLVGVEGTSAEENLTFTRLAHHFAARGVRVPRVCATSRDGMRYLQTDLGDTSLYDCLAACRDTGVWDDAARDLLARCLRQLAYMQTTGSAGLDFRRVCRPVSRMDSRAVLYDLNYFKYCFLKTTGCPVDENSLQDDFERLARELPAATPAGFMYRDFQSRNVMVSDGEPWFIDFQGGRYGPVLYDVASFLWQARAQYPDELRLYLLGIYIDALRQQGIDVDEAAFRHELMRFVLFRTMQVLGAYGFRGYYEGKLLFRQSIAPAIDGLRQLLAADVCKGYDGLQATLTRLVSLPRWQPQPPRTTLCVTVYSFSYRMGIPDDDSGNGGGFVFDCRAIHNPGRYPQYAPLTGRDEPVIRFLEEGGEIQPFIAHACALVDAAVRKYRARHFTHLQVAFGCTGGRHRSVYSAEALVSHLRGQYPDIEIRLIHREQGITTTYPPHTHP